MDTVSTREIIAYHGWGFDRTCWQSWADRFEQAGIKFRVIDRGYFGAASGGENPSKRDGQPDLQVLWDGHLARPIWAGKMPTPQLSRSFNSKVAHHASKVIFVHSYGLHLCPIADLLQAELLVIFSSFQTFHPFKESPKRRSQQILRQMLMQLENKPELVLDNFRQKCDAPSVQSPMTCLNLDRLVEDLQDLDTCAIDLTLLANLPQILVFHGSSDRIVPVQKGQELVKALSSNSQYFEIADAGHALPFTHLEQCWSVVQQAVTQC